MQEREREGKKREKEREREKMCVCVREREREKSRVCERKGYFIIIIAVVTSVNLVKSIYNNISILSGVI